MSPLTEPTKLILKKDSVAATDTNIREVSLLLHGNGANGSTTIIDSSLNPKTVTAVGNAQISTAQSKFGGASIALDGNGDALSIAGLQSLAQFTASGQVGTCEGWIYINSFTSPRSFLFGVYDGSLERGWTLDLTTAGNAFVGNNSSGPSITLSSAFALSSWQHLAFVNTGSLLLVFRDGQQVGSTSNQAPISAAIDFRVGARGSTNILPFNGYIDELRITQGIARYTSNFTPPTAPFPDF